MLRRCTLLLLVFTLLTGWAFPACAGGMSNADKYQAALTELKKVFDGENTMPLEDLCAVWEGLGSYKKSVAFRCYTMILLDVEKAYYSNITLYTSVMRLDEDFCAMLAEEELPSVDEMEAYAMAKQAENTGDLTAAIGYYEKSIAVLDSMARMMELRLKSPTVAQPAAPQKPASTTPVPSPATPTPAPATPAPTTPPVAIITQTNVTADKYRITTYSNNTCQVTRYTGSGKTIIIPGQLNGLRVTSIGENAFSKNKNITSVTIPDGVTSIGKKAFYFCTKLQSVTLPDSLTTLEGHSFYYCDFRSITLPASLKTIGSNAFGFCRNLINVTIPEGVTTIGGWAFSSCDDLIQVVIPRSVTSIGDQAFFQCYSLTLVVPANSYAQQYAIEYNIPYTTY